MPRNSNKPKVASSKGGAAKTKKEQAASESKNIATRQLEQPKRIWYKPLTWRHRPPVPAYKPLPKARLLFWCVLKQLWEHRWVFGGIVLIYGLFNLFLVRGLAGSTDLTNLKDTLDNALHGFGGQLASSATTFAYLLASSGTNSTAASGVYQVVLIIVCSLAFIWALRQTLAANEVRVRDSFYKGMYPLIPFLLVMALIAVQLVPLAAGGGLYAVVISHGIAIGWWEKALFVVLFIALGLWSLRMLTASIFALYIVSLPDMTPLRAYRSARKLVYGRRLLIWRKLIFLPIVLLLLAAGVEIPMIFLLTPLAEWTFFVISMITLPVTLGYFYNLYRDML